MGEKQTLVSLIASHDNLDEPIPLANRPATVLGAIITFMVRTISFMIISWTCGLLRLWTRVRVVKAAGWDDLFVVLSLFSTALGAIVVCIGIQSYGLGKHFIQLGGPEAMSNYLKGFYIANGSYLLSTTFIKLALLLQCLRIFDRGSVLYRFSFGMIIFVALWGVSFNIVGWFPCSPIGGYWSLDADANCWGFASQNPTAFQATFETHAAFNMVLDLIVLALPVQLYFQPHARTNTGWGLSGLLVLGAVTTFVSAWRLATIVEHRAATWPTFDPSWYGCESILLAVLELDLALICASVPVFWPVFQTTGFKIFVTEEVEITRESRRLGSTDAAMGGVELGFTDGMTTGPCAGASALCRSGSNQSKNGSEGSLDKARSCDTDSSRAASREGWKRSGCGGASD